MKKYLLLFALVFSSIIFPQTATINESQENYTVRLYYSADPLEYSYDFNSAHDIGNFNVEYGKWMDWVSCFKISLDGVPAGYTIKSVNITASITE
jgi:hypothetical protein